MTAERGFELDKGEIPRESSRTDLKIQKLLSDIEPFFYGRPLVYVDVGAHKGNIFREVHASSLTLRSAHLIEPNPTSFAALETTVRELGAEKVATCYNVAVAAAPQRLQLRDADDMTKVLGPALGSDGVFETNDLLSFEAEALTLDGIFQALQSPHISILKIDVEGYEREVFAGAAGLLSTQSIDLIYVEAGLNPAGAQQTYYRDIEDLLGEHGYRLFRIYEQMHEWIEDSPFLRRVNLAFLSSTFADQSPFRLSRKLFSAKSECRALKQALAKAEAQREATEGKLASSTSAYEARITEANQLVSRQVEALAMRDIELEHAQQRLKAQENEANKLKVTLETRLQDIAQLTARHTEALAKRDIALAHAQQRLETQESEASERKKALETRFQEIAQLTAKLEASIQEASGLRKRIDALTKSTAWRLTAPARSIVDLVRRRGRV
jgi:FkbM family methyltransferase